MFDILKRGAVALGAATLAACGSHSSTTGTANTTNTTRGALGESPPFRIASLDASTFTSQLAAATGGAQLLQLTGIPLCGVDFYYVTFWTVGGAGETTESSGALMVPTGAAPACSGPRPIVEYAHGESTDKALNIADITNTSNTEGATIAAMFAAQGYIVVAPNYAGYDISTLGYYPWLNAVQNADEMIDVLAAARTALPNTLSNATSDNGQLFLAGYSTGGYVAMATLRAMQAAGAKVTAAAPMSGPYALEAFGDAIIFGSVDLGSTVFASLLTASYQHAYGNINSAENPPFSSTYADAESLLPSDTPIDTIFAEGLLPETALFDSTTPVVSIPNEPALSAELTALLGVPPTPALPLSPETPIFDLGFGKAYLLTNDYRVSYALDAASNPDGAVPTPTPGVPLAKVKPSQGLRQDLYLNDMRSGWFPKVPTLLCGGDLDPTVYFSVNTQTMAAYWSALPPGAVTVLDVSATPAGPSAQLQAAFQQAGAQLLAYLQTPAGGGLTLAQAEAQLVQGYHTDVRPFCSAAAREFFSQF
ncbi:MAG TPA: prolyl oligopeptidase family serine peptidase [Steroidobacteraceae bacterium]|nr:prolyl oligopeptidase family serine peptidase [Steroidobacteraceae bacterium]HXZ15819.1 prolyl oligopeptidase family serine peptidase [Roseiarcus sp.]